MLVRLKPVRSQLKNGDLKMLGVIIYWTLSVTIAWAITKIIMWCENKNK